MSSKKRMIIRWVVLIILLIAGVTVFYVRKALGEEDKQSQSGTKDRYSIVRRGSFTISVSVDGNLEAIERHLIKPVPGSAKYGLELVHVVEDGAEVKRGDLLFKFSDKNHIEREEELLLELDDARTSLMLASEDLQMTKAGNLSAIKAATVQLRDSREKLSRYEEDEAPRKKRDLIAAIGRSQDKLEQARQEVVEARDKVSNAQMQDATEVPALEKKLTQARQQVEQVETELEKAHAALRVFKQYDHPQQMRTLTEAATRAEMALQKELVLAAGNVVKARRRIQNHETRIAQLEEEMAQLMEIRENLVLTAPVDGIVSLGNPHRRHWQSAADLKVGAKVQAGQTIASIPDLSKFVVDIEIPEELRSRVRIGQPAVLASKAIPDLIIEGELGEIAAMAQNVIRWDRSSPKVYDAQLSTDSVDPRLMPGMTMKVEINVEEVKKVLYVPLEAVYNREGKKYCRVKTLTGLEEREVETGRMSTDYVEIVSGLKLGERVALHQPGLME